MSLPPWVVFLLLFSLSLALIYQLATRRYGWRLLGYWLLIFLTAAVFEAAAESAGFNATRFGDIRLAPDFAGAGLALLALWFVGI